MFRLSSSLSFPRTESCAYRGTLYDEVHVILLRKAFIQRLNSTSCTKPAAVFLFINSGPGFLSMCSLIHPGTWTVGPNFMLCLRYGKEDRDLPDCTPGARSRPLCSNGQWVVCFWSKWSSYHSLYFVRRWCKFAGMSLSVEISAPVLTLSCVNDSLSCWGWSTMAQRNKFWPSACRSASVV